MHWLYKCKYEIRSPSQKVSCPTQHSWQRQSCFSCRTPFRRSSHRLLPVRVHHVLSQKYFCNVWDEKEVDSTCYAGIWWCRITSWVYHWVYSYGNVTYGTLWQYFLECFYFYGQRVRTERCIVCAARERSMLVIQCEPAWRMLLPSNTLHNFIVDSFFQPSINLCSLSFYSGRTFRNAGSPPA